MKGIVVPLIWKDEVDLAFFEVKICLVELSQSLVLKTKETCHVLLICNSKVIVRSVQEI